MKGLMIFLKFILVILCVPFAIIYFFICQAYSLVDDFFFNITT